MNDPLQPIIEEAWERARFARLRTTARSATAVEAAVIDGLDSGQARVAEKGADGWTVNQWLKKAVLL